MAIITSTTILTSLSLFHITLAYYFLTSPDSISDQALVFIIGESMGMPHARSFDTKSQPLAFLAALFFVVGVTDLVSVSLPEEVTQYHWGNQAPVRLLLFGAISLYGAAFGPASPLYEQKAYVPSTWGEGLKSRLVFTWAFLEMVTWFWVWLTLREERLQFAARLAQRREAEENML